MCRFGLKLPQARQSGRIQLALFHGIEHGAAGLSIVSAIAESTVPGDFFDLREDLAEAFLQVEGRGVIAAAACWGTGASERRPVTFEIARGAALRRPPPGGR